MNADDAIKVMFTQSKHPKVVVEVCDTGVGIHPDDQRKLFKMFTMLRDTRQMNSNGVGLGLYISKQITRKFGGLICVKSNVNQGSRFFFCFNIQDARITPKNPVRNR